MPCPHNLEKPIDFWLRKGKAVGETEPTEKECPCTKEGCPRHGKCCECVAHHKEHGKKLPVCLRGIDWEK